MAKGRTPPPCSMKYGMPLFSASWVPLHAIDFTEEKGSGGSENTEEEVKDECGVSAAPDFAFLALSGGGGDSRTGVKNSIFLSKFDFSSGSLSSPLPSTDLGIMDTVPGRIKVDSSSMDEWFSTKVDQFYTEGDLPYRTAVHPGGKGLICSFPKNCRWFEWDASRTQQVHKLTLKPSDKILNELQDVGQQIALSFNLEGSMLACGGEDGHLRVFKWPSMEIAIEQSNVHECFKDIDFSPEGKLLVTLGDSGPCRVWDLESSTAVAALSREKGETFGFCKFSRDIRRNLLYMVIKRGGRGFISMWDTGSWKKISEKQITQDSVSAFNISPDGSLFAIGTSEGEIVIFDLLSMQRREKIKDAHLVFVTALEFSHDSRKLVSTSGDSSARVTVIEDKKHQSSSIAFILFIILLSILLFFLKKNQVF